MPLLPEPPPSHTVKPTSHEQMSFESRQIIPYEREKDTSLIHLGQIQVNYLPPKNPKDHLGHRIPMHRQPTRLHRMGWVAVILGMSLFLLPITSYSRNYNIKITSVQLESIITAEHTMTNKLV